MKFQEDPRMSVCRKCFFLAWIYFSIYLLVIMILSYALGTKPYILGLPRWVAIGNILIPIVFVLALIIVVEKLIPNIPLVDDEKGEDKR